MFAILLLAMTPLDVVEIPTEEPTVEASASTDNDRFARAMERIMNAPVPPPPKPKVTPPPPEFKINIEPWPVIKTPPKEHAMPLPIPYSHRTGVRNTGAPPPLPDPAWYERFEPEGWQVALAFKIAVLALLIRWLHRKGWLAATARFVQAHWAQVIGLLLLGFIALKLGGFDFPGWRAVLGIPDATAEFY